MVNKLVERARVPMRILIVGFEPEIDKIVGLLEEKYLSSQEDIVETCLWHDSVSLNSLLVEKEVQYDWYIVAAHDRVSSSSVCKILQFAFQIPAEKIIDYQLFYEATMPFLRADRMLAIPGKNYEGIILGISHAQVGIIPELLDGDYVNLAFSSQDLFYNYKTLEYCLKTYPEKFVGLKHIIIDMFDYTYFNYDVSRSKTFYEYIGWGGYSEDQHNYSMNKNYDCDLDIVQRMILDKLFEGVTDAKLDFWEDLFGDVHEKDLYNGYVISGCIAMRNRIVTDDDVNEYKVEVPIVSKRFEDTIEENKEIFNQLINLARSVNPGMRITCILLPRYAKAQEKSAVAYENWEKEFYTTVNQAVEEFGIEFFDFKKHEIASRKELFHDVAHFNYAGAIMFSKLLSNTLRNNTIDTV